MTIAFSHAGTPCGTPCIFPFHPSTGSIRRLMCDARADRDARHCGRAPGKMIVRRVTGNLLEAATLSLAGS